MDFNSCRTAAIEGIIAALATYLLYRNLPVAVFAGLAAATWSCLDKKRRKTNKRRQAELDFSQYLTCLLPLFSVARPLGKTLVMAADDYAGIHGESPFLRSVRKALHQANMNRDPGKGFDALAEEFGMEDLRLFAHVLALCEKSGGNIAESIRTSMEMIRDKIMIRLEIDTILAEKNMERKIITVMPLGILALFSLTAPTYLDPLYMTWSGRIAVTLAGLLFLLQWFLGKRISSIEV